MRRVALALLLLTLAGCTSKEPAPAPAHEGPDGLLVIDHNDHVYQSSFTITNPDGGSVAWSWTGSSWASLPLQSEPDAGVAGEDHLFNVILGVRGDP